MKYKIYEEIPTNNYRPYESKHAVRPNPGDSIIVNRVDNSIIEVVCIKDNNSNKVDTCLSFPLGDNLCLMIPMKCNDNIAFVDINVLEGI